MKPDPTSNASSDRNSGRFFDGLTRFVVAILPFALGAGLIAIRLPPWFDEMAKLWGPGFIILGIIVMGFLRYVPPGALRDIIKAQTEQAEAMRGVQRALENIERQMQDYFGPNGEFAEIKKQVDHIDWRLGFALNLKGPQPMGD